MSLFIVNNSLSTVLKNIPGQNMHDNFITSIACNYTVNNLWIINVGKILSYKAKKWFEFKIAKGHFKAKIWVLGHIWAQFGHNQYICPL